MSICPSAVQVLPRSPLTAPAKSGKAWRASLSRLTGQVLVTAEEQHAHVSIK